jgi:tripartite-type tricarboxylate transporter receptor subunit TctC
VKRAEEKLIMHSAAARTLRAFVVCFGSFAVAPSPSLAEVWPERGVKIITSFPAGTGGDLSARLYAERLALRWGKSVVVENKPGADGILAVTAVIGMRDNHTLLYTNGGPVTTNAFNHDNLPYDPVRDLIPISSGADVSIAVSIPASLKIDSLAGFVALARAQPGKLNWGATPGALDYVVPSFLKRAGLDLTHVSYREIAPALQDLAEGRIHLYVSALASQLGMVGSANIKVIAITNRERSPLVAQAQTTAEAGFPELSLEGFLGFFSPQGISKDLADRIGADIRAVGADPAIGARLASGGLIARTNTAAEFGEIIEHERAKVAAIARAGDGKAKR